MFEEKEMSVSSRRKDHLGDTFNKLLGHQGGNLFYISKREDNGDFNMIAMVIFAVLEK
jgi:hypothetical protein